MRKNRTTIVSLALSLVIGASGLMTAACNSDSTQFPSLPQESVSESSSDSSVETDPPTADVEELTVALPYSEDTIRYLSELFYAKNNGIWDSTQTGENVELSYLDAINTNYVISNVGVSDEGASIANYDTWVEDGIVPDMFLSSDSSAFFDKGYTVELNEYLAESEYIEPSLIYSGSLEFNSDEGIYYGVPHYSSAVILMGNNDFIPDSGRPASQYSIGEFSNYLTAISGQYSEVVPLASAYELTPYICSCFDQSTATSYMMYDEFIRGNTDLSALQHSVDYIQNLYDTGLSFIPDQDGADPVYSRNAALWLETSAHISTWSEYYPSNLYLMRLPIDSSSDIDSVYLQNYALCVSSDSDNADFAASFAEFISFDTDAQLLIYRLETMTGFMPVVRSSSVWDLVENDSSFGAMAAAYEQLSDDAIYCPGSYDNNIYRNVNKYLSDFYSSDEEFDAEACYGT